MCNVCKNIKRTRRRHGTPHLFPSHLAPVPPHTCERGSAAGVWSEGKWCIKEWGNVCKIERGMIRMCGVTVGLKVNVE